MYSYEILYSMPRGKQLLCCFTQNEAKTLHEAFTMPRSLICRSSKWTRPANFSYNT